MPSLNFLSENLNKVLAGTLLLLLGGSLVSYVLYGSYYSPDTVNYFNFSQSLFGQSMWTGIYSPAYPFLLHCLPLLPFLSLFQAAHLLILVQYGLSIYVLYQWANRISTHYGFTPNREMGFLLLLLIIYHAWWSFRIFTWAHADGMFYCLLIMWVFVLSRYYLENGFKHLIILSLLSTGMVWVKLNALAFVPFYALLVILDKTPTKWLVPFGMTAASYFGYRYLFRYGLFDHTHADADSGMKLLTGENLSLLGNNVAELYKSTLGFLLSDVVTAYIPYVFGAAGGVLLLLLLLFLSFKEIKAGLPLSSLFLLFGLTYLLCQLAFEQLMGYEEINYRTLYPYFLSFGIYCLVKIFHRDQLPTLVILLVALLLCGHTLAGHLYLWQRQEVSSLFEAERLTESAMVKEARVLHQKSAKKTNFISDRPEQLALLLNDPFVVHYDPEFVFVAGKRRPVPDQQRQERRTSVMEKLRNGEVVMVLFAKDKKWLAFAREHGLQVQKFEEGVILGSGREGAN